MKKGDTAKILPSCALSSLKLGSLAGQEGVIVEVVGKPDAKGCWVRLEAPYLGELEWYIPAISLEA